MWGTEEKRQWGTGNDWRIGSTSKVVPKRAKECVPAISHKILSLDHETNAGTLGWKKKREMSSKRSSLREKNSEFSQEGKTMDHNPEKHGPRRSKRGVVGVTKDEDCRRQRRHQPKALKKINTSEKCQK